MKTIFRWLVPLMGIVLMGCAGMKPVVEDYLDVAKSHGVSQEYLQQLEKWTRKSILYSEFETRAYLVATYASPEFREAYEKEDARLYAAAPKDRQPEKDAAKSEPVGGDMLFYVYAYNPDSEAVDFSKADSIWKIFLTDNRGGRLEPSEIRQIKKITPRIEQFYPYVNQYHGKFYLIRFPQPPPAAQGQQKLNLVFTGVLGRVEIVWP